MGRCKKYLQHVLNPLHVYSRILDAVDTVIKVYEWVHQRVIKRIIY